MLKSSSSQEFQHQLNSLTKKLLDTADTYEAQRKGVENLLKEAHIELSVAKVLLGPACLSSISYNNTMTATTILNESQQLEKKGDKNPIHWFGYLAPRPLVKSQALFSIVLNRLVMLNKTMNDLKSIEKDLIQTRTRFLEFEKSIELQEFQQESALQQKDSALVQTHD